jgi:hypothetical protein
MWQAIAGDFRGVVAATGTRNRIYTIDQDTGLYPLVPATGAYEEPIATGWHARMLTALGERLFLPHEGRLHRVTHGTSDAFDDSWHGITHLAAAGDRVFAIAERALYSIDPDTGACEQLGGSWDARHLIGVAAQLFVCDRDNGLYRVDPVTGASDQLANSWAQTTALATAGGQLFAIDAGVLYRVDLQSGGCEEIEAASHTRLLVGCGSWLYSIETGGELYRLSVA